MILIVGTPGAGKTTQTRQLAEYLNAPWASMGELIRQNAKGKDRQQMLKGIIIDDKPTLDILWQAIRHFDLVKNEFVLEGNPRSITQAKWWLEKIKDKKVKLTGIIHLVCSEKVAAQRMVKRGRLDDYDSDVINKRFSEYRRTIKPTMAFLKKQGLTINQVDANGTPDAAFEQIKKILGV